MNQVNNDCIFLRLVPWTFGDCAPCRQYWPLLTSGVRERRHTPRTLSLGADSSGRILQLHKLYNQQQKWAHPKRSEYPLRMVLELERVKIPTQTVLTLTLKATIQFGYQVSQIKSRNFKRSTQICVKQEAAQTYGWDCRLLPTNRMFSDYSSCLFQGAKHAVKVFQILAAQKDLAGKGPAQSKFTWISQDLLPHLKGRTMPWREAFQQNNRLKVVIDHCNIEQYVCSAHFSRVLRLDQDM